MLTMVTQPPADRLVVLENARIEAMLRNAAIVREFPFLQGMAAKVAGTRKGCGGCGRKTRQNVLDYEGVKTAIGHLPLEQKNRLKTMLNAQSIRVTFLNHRGQKVKQTF